MKEQTDYSMYSAENQLRKYADKLLNVNNISVAFSDAYNNMTKNDLIPAPCLKGEDIRHLVCLTIDGDDTKDMDDAVSLVKTQNGYELGVHIADVAAYVTPGSMLDDEATARGTSIYLPHQTIPMLPGILSNDLCSLNADTDRYTVSAIIDLDRNGQVNQYRFTKALIRSRIKGSYKEVNSLLNLDGCSEVAKKYAPVSDMLFEMQKLAEILRDSRIQNGLKKSSNNEPKIIIDDGEIELVPNQYGVAESIIEEFMVLANRLIAEYFRANNLPAIYRIQRAKKTLAGYQIDLCHHAELALDQYIHFTSPIRRLADLKVHQVLSAFLNGVGTDNLHMIFDEVIESASEIAEKRSRSAKSIQKSVRKFCYANYFDTRHDQIFTGTVVGQDDRSNQPIIMLYPFNICIKASSRIRIFEGQQFSLKVQVDLRNRNLTAYELRRVS